MSDPRDPETADRPLSAAFVSPSWPPDASANGIIPYVADVAVEMRRVGHRVTVMVRHLTGEAGGDVVDLDAYRPRRGLARRLAESLAYRLSARREMGRRAVRAMIAGCEALMADRGLQVVEMEESYGWSLPVQRELPIPIVVRLHGPWFLNGPLREDGGDAGWSAEKIRAEGDAIRQARAITAASRDVLERTREHYGLALPDARVIHPSTKMVPVGERWSESGAEPGTVLFVGRFDRHKGGDLLIDAFAEVARRHPAARLLFVGPDSGLSDDAGRRWGIEDYLRERLGDLATTDRVEWLGWQPSAAIPALRRKAALVVVASRYDNFPVTVLEAMAMGCPLVAPRIGGIPEIVEDGANGLLFEAGRPADMAEKIGRLLEDRPLAAGLGQRAGVDVASRHDPEVIAGQVAGFFREVIAGRARPGGGGNGP